MSSENYKFYAFISYKSDDVKWAKWLQKRFENYSLPVTLQKENKLPRKLSPVFRDGTDILPKELKSELNQKLEQSRYLIVLCSPRSAASPWVGDEIEQFCQMGRRDRIIAVIIDGSPYSNDPTTECYHPKLREWFPKGDDVSTDRQLLGADIHAAIPESNRYKKERAFIQVVATMLNLPFDALWNRRRRQLILTLTLAVILFLTVVSTITATWLAGRPFDVGITIDEQTPHNASLPVENGRVALISGNDTLSVKQINSLDTPISFDNIAGKFRGEQLRLSFQMYGFCPVDSLISLSDSHVLSIRRDATFAVYAGQVLDSETSDPVPGATVSIEGLRSVTDADGYFHIEFPVESQSLIKNITITKEGYHVGDYDLQPQTDHCLLIFR